MNRHEYAQGMQITNMQSNLFTAEDLLRDFIQYAGDTHTEGDCKCLMCLKLKAKSFIQSVS